MPPVPLYLLDSGANPHLYSEFDAMTPIQAAQQTSLTALKAKLEQMGVVAPEQTVKPSRWFDRLFVRRRR